jgi:hypothetical protein
MTSEPKRHHYVPRFLLKRFAEHPDAKKPSVWWLSKATGANARRNVENEAVIGHYYRISNATDVPAGFPEKVLSDIEGPAAEAIREVETQPRSLSLEHRQALALFVVLQHKRTPAGREHLRFVDELTHRLLTEVNLNNPESWADAMKTTGDFESDEQAERERLETLRDFQEGRVIVESTPDREIAGMFLAAPEVSSFLATDAFSWSLLQPNGEQRFVLGDSPVALYETGSPEKPGGLGFAAPGVETTLPLSPTTCLLLRPRAESRLRVIPVDDNAVRHINLRSYAWAQRCIWGASHQDVVDVRIAAKQDPDALYSVRRRDGVPWIGVPVPGQPNVYDFEGHFADGRRQHQRAYVDPKARES